MSTMQLTQVYLEPVQKKALSAQAKKSGKKVSELVRDAIDAALVGITLDELKTLDEGTKRAQSELKAMVSELKANSDEHAKFTKEMAKLEKLAAKAAL
jgi:hypothetical protein